MGRLTAEHLGLAVEAYDPVEHYTAVRDKWSGLRTPDGRDKQVKAANLIDWICAVLPKVGHARLRLHHGAPMWNEFIVAGSK
jgi:hypothetical protein